MQCCFSLRRRPQDSLVLLWKHFLRNCDIIFLLLWILFIFYIAQWLAGVFQLLRIVCCQAVNNFQITPPHILPLFDFFFSVTGPALTLSPGSASPFHLRGFMGQQLKSSEYLISAITGLPVNILTACQKVPQQDTMRQLLLSWPH